MSSLPFEGHTAVITEGNDLGIACSLYLSTLGANVLVNDVNPGISQRIATQIRQRGNIAVESAFPVTDGAAIIQAALNAFGKITILINNATISNEKSLDVMSTADFEEAQQIHLKGTFTCTRAAWPHFRQQKFGRVLNFSSVAGIYGQASQAHTAAANMGIVALTKTLAQEGMKFGVQANVIIPQKYSEQDLTTAFAAALVHPHSPHSGKLFELSHRHASELRWERSKGTIFEAGDSYTPSAAKHKWRELTDFTAAEHPQSIADINVKDITNAVHIPRSPPPDIIKFHDQTVIVTAAGQGLGRAYALMYGRLGANVVVHDVTTSAKAVADEIVASGGKAVSITCPTEQGEAIANAALERYKSIHVLVANERVMRSASLGHITDEDWETVVHTNLRGCFNCVKAVWPIFQRQKYGRIVTACSANGLYGSRGTASYSTVKAAVLGFTRTLSIEGRPYNILANAIAPSVGPATTNPSQELRRMLKSENFAPVVGFLTSTENHETTGDVFEIFGPWAAQTRWQRSGGYSFPPHGALEDVLAKMPLISEFNDGHATYPSSVEEVLSETFRETAKL